ncbi:hypothetical protein CA152_08880 [Campylobacter upsaliensis]|nr:hypothetical protein [Campylobacter upsaliensis]
MRSIWAGVPLGCNKFKAKRDGLGFSFESCRGELGAKQKGGEAFSVLLLLAKIAIFALKRR